MFARTKFPEPKGLALALMEEFTEWANETDPEKKKKELLQVACVAMRLIEENDPLEEHARVHGLKRGFASYEWHVRQALAEVVGEDAAKKSDAS